MATRSIPATLLLASGLLAPGQEIPHHLQPPSVGILLSFQHQPAPGFLKRLQKDVEDLFRPTGLHLRWQVLGGTTRPGVYDRAVVIDLRGRCDPARIHEVAPDKSGVVKLGWTIINEGEVMPHSVVECDDIARVVPTMREPGINHHFLQDLHRRLAARVVAHELLHMLLKTSDHSDSECLRSPLRRTDLMRQPRLSPAEVAGMQQIGRARGAALAHR